MKMIGLIVCAAMCFFYAKAAITYNSIDPNDKEEKKRGLKKLQRTFLLIFAVALVFAIVYVAVLK
jgi:hypothetical protein